MQNLLSWKDNCKVHKEVKWANDKKSDFLSLLSSVEGGLKTGMGRPEGKCKLKWWHGDLTQACTKIRDSELCGSTSNRAMDVPSTMYSFMKAARFTHLNLEGTKCRIVYNHHRKTTKIGNGWRTFAQTQNLLPGTQIDATSNFIAKEIVLFPKPDDGFLTDGNNFYKLDNVRGEFHEIHKDFSTQSHPYLTQVFTSFDTRCAYD
ncbi:hypothetical protein JHK87_049807 [Glycine soja]|nr:hypothetical protein JHK87_049807 [Glycine soja]